VGFEPTLPYGKGILSPLRLPFRHRPWTHVTFYSLLVHEAILEVCELLFVLPAKTLARFITLDTIICMFLIADFFLRLNLSQDKGWYFRRYWIDLISSIPFYGILRIGRLVRINRFLRLFRLLRLSRALRVILSRSDDPSSPGGHSFVCSQAGHGSRIAPRGHTVSRRLAPVENRLKAWYTMAATRFDCVGIAKGHC
jgi:hypothetical protein